MIKAIIFDCFGVLCIGARTYAVQQCPVEKRQQLDDLFDQADYGYITTQEFIEQGAELLELDIPAFNDMIHKRYAYDESMLALIRRLRGSYKVALLSNANDTIIEELFPSELRKDLFDDVVVSSSVGLIKPDVRLFEYAIRRLDLVPEECVMVDDIEQNITSAARIGMKGIVFTDRVQCERALEELGVHA